MGDRLVSQNRGVGGELHPGQPGESSACSETLAAGLPLSQDTRIRESWASERNRMSASSPFIPCSASNPDAGTADWTAADVPEQPTRAVPPIDDTVIGPLDAGAGVVGGAVGGGLVGAGAVGAGAVGADAATFVAGALVGVGATAGVVPVVEGPADDPGVDGDGPEVAGGAGTVDPDDPDPDGAGAAGEPEPLEPEPDGPGLGLDVPPRTTVVPAGPDAGVVERLSAEEKDDPGAPLGLMGSGVVGADVVRDAVVSAAGTVVPPPTSTAGSRRVGWVIQTASADSSASGKATVRTMTAATSTTAKVPITPVALPSRRSHGARARRGPSPITSRNGIERRARAATGDVSTTTTRPMAGAPVGGTSARTGPAVDGSVTTGSPGAWGRAQIVGSSGASPVSGLGDGSTPPSWAMGPALPIGRWSYDLRPMCRATTRATMAP